MDRIHEDMLMEPARAVALQRQWQAEERALKLLLAALPPGTTRAQALAHHRALAQVGRRPSACMAERTK